MKKGDWLSFILLILLVIFLLALGGCNVFKDYRYVSKEQKRRVKKVKKMNKKREELTWTHFGLQSDSAKWQGMRYRPEYFYYSDTEIFHVDSYGQHSRLNWGDLKVLNIDSLKTYYLEKNAERD